MILPYCLALTCSMVAVGFYSLFKRRIVVYSHIHAEMFIAAHQFTCFALQRGLLPLWLVLLVMTTLVLLMCYFRRCTCHAYSFPGVRKHALKQSVAQLAADLSLNIVMPENKASAINDKFIIDFPGGALSVSAVRARTVSGESVLRQVVFALKPHFYRNPQMLLHWLLAWDVFLWVIFVWLVALFWWFPNA